MAISSRQEITPRLLRAAGVGAARPRLTVIVAADVPRHWLDFLVTLLPRPGLPLAVEVLVMRPGGRRTSDERDPRHSAVRYIAAPAHTTCAELRAQGMRHANGDVVMFLDGDCPVDPGLFERLADNSEKGRSPINPASPERGVGA